MGRQGCVHACVEDRLLVLLSTYKESFNLLTTSHWEVQYSLDNNSASSGVPTNYCAYQLYMIGLKYTRTGI